MPAEEVGFTLEDYGDLEFITMNVGEKRKFCFLESVPGREFPMTKIKEHYIAEKQGSKYIMCNGGLCCEYETWNNFEKAYTKSKAKTVYWVPAIFYYSDVDTMKPKADIGILVFNWFQYKKYLDQIQMIVPGTKSFFDQDIWVSFDKQNTYSDYTFTVQGIDAMWKQNPEMKAFIEERLETLADRIKACYPTEYTEVELAAEIEKWNAAKAARIANENAQAEQAVVDANAQMTQQYQQPVQQAYQQPVQQQFIQPTQVAQQVGVTPAVAQAGQPIPQAVTTPAQVNQPAPQVTQTVIQQGPLPEAPMPQATVQQELPEQPAPAVNPVSTENFTLADLASVLQTPAAQ